MNPAASELLTERLDRLERELRWWRCVGLAAFLILAALVLIGQALPGGKVLEAEKFVVKDARGSVRAVLGREHHGVPIRPDGPSMTGQYGLHFYGSDGTYRAAVREFGDADESWVVELLAKDTPSTAYLGVGNGLAHLDLQATEQSREAAESDRAKWAKKFNAAKTPEEREKLGFGPTFNGVEARLSAFPKGTSQLSLRHGLGGGFDFFLLHQQPSLNIIDEKGVGRAVLGHTKLEHRGGILEERPPSSIVLFDKDGKSIWKAP